MERADFSHQQHHAWTHSNQYMGKLKPSDVFKRHFLNCFIDDKFGMASREFLNMDHVMWECDYPHSDSTWPWAPEELMPSLEGCSDHDIDRVTHLNAMKHFEYDPFSILGGKANCTVGALREKAKGHDVAIRSVNKANIGKHAALATDLMVPSND